MQERETHLRSAKLSVFMVANVKKAFVSNNKSLFKRRETKFS